MLVNLVVCISVFFLGTPDADPRRGPRATGAVERAGPASWPTCSPSPCPSLSSSTPSPAISTGADHPLGLATSCPALGYCMPCTAGRLWPVRLPPVRGPRPGLIRTPIPAQADAGRPSTSIDLRRSTRSREGRGRPICRPDGRSDGTRGFMSAAALRTGPQAFSNRAAKGPSLLGAGCSGSIAVGADRPRPWSLTVGLLGVLITSRRRKTRPGTGRSPTGPSRDGLGFEPRSSATRKAFRSLDVDSGLYPGRRGQLWEHQPDPPRRGDDRPGGLL